MKDEMSSEAAVPARLLLVDEHNGLAQLAGPLAAEFVVSPIVVELATGRAAIDLLMVRSQGCSISAALEGMRAGAHDCVGADLEPAAMARRIADLARRHGKGQFLVPAPAPATAMPHGQAAAAPQIPVMRDLVLP